MVIQNATELNNNATGFVLLCLVRFVVRETWTISKTMKDSWMTAEVCFFLGVNAKNIIRKNLEKWSIFGEVKSFLKIVKTF